MEKSATDLFEDDPIDVSNDFTDRIARAFAGGLPSANNRRPNAQSGPTNRVTVIPEINSAYHADPVAAVIANVPLYERPEDIEIWNADGRIGRMVEHQDEAARRAEQLQRNPRYQFSNLVLAYVSEQNRATNSNIVPPQPAFRVISPPNADVYRQIPRSEGEDAGPVFSIGPSTNEEQTDEQRRARDRAEQEFRYERQISDALQTVGVSGTFRLDPKVSIAVMNALARLTSQNPKKFSKHELDHFLGSEDVMAYMVSMTGLHIILQNIINATRYYHDRDSKRRRNEIDHLAGEMDRVLDFDHGKNLFYVMEPQDINQETITIARRVRYAKRGRILD